MARCITPSFVDGFPYPLHAVLPCGSLAESFIIPLLEGFHDSIRAVLLVTVLVGFRDRLLVGYLIGVLVGQRVRIHVGLDTLLQRSR